MIVVQVLNGLDGETLEVGFVEEKLKSFWACGKVLF